MTTEDKIDLILGLVLSLLMFVMGNALVAAIEGSNDCKVPKPAIVEKETK